MQTHFKKNSFFGRWEYAILSAPQLPAPNTGVVHDEANAGERKKKINQQPNTTEHALYISNVVGGNESF